MDRPKTFEIKLTEKQQEYLKIYLFDNPDISVKYTLSKAVGAFFTYYFDNQETDLNNISNINDTRLHNLLSLIDGAFNSSEDSKNVNEDLLKTLKDYQQKNPTATYAQIIYDIAIEAKVKTLFLPVNYWFVA